MGGTDTKMPKCFDELPIISSISPEGVMWECEDPGFKAGLLATCSRREEEDGSDNVSENSNVNAFLQYILRCHFIQCEDSKMTLVITGTKSLYTEVIKNLRPEIFCCGLQSLY